MDTRSFHWHGRDTSFPCLLGYNKSKQIVYEKFEAALKVERTVSVLTQGWLDSKRGSPSTSQPGTSHSNRKKGKKWTGGRGSGRGVASSQGSVRSPAAIGGGRSSGSSFPLCLHVRGGISESAK